MHLPGFELAIFRSWVGQIKILPHMWRKGFPCCAEVYSRRKGFRAEEERQRRDAYLVFGPRQGKKEGRRFRYIFVRKSCSFRSKFILVSQGVARRHSGRRRRRKTFVLEEFMSEKWLSFPVHGDGTSFFGLGELSAVRFRAFPPNLYCPLGGDR